MRRYRDGVWIKIVRRKENGRIGMEEIFVKSSKAKKEKKSPCKTCAGIKTLPLGWAIGKPIQAQD